MTPSLLMLINSTLLFLFELVGFFESVDCAPSYPPGITFYSIRPDFSTVVELAFFMDSLCWLSVPPELSFPPCRSEITPEWQYCLYLVFNSHQKTYSPNSRNPQKHIQSRGEGGGDMIVTDCHSGNSCLDALPRMCQPDLPWPGTTPILLLHSVLISWQSLVVLTVFEAIVKSYPSKLRSSKDDHN